VIVKIFGQGPPPKPYLGATSTNQESKMSDISFSILMAKSMDCRSTKGTLSLFCLITKLKDLTMQVAGSGLYCAKSLN